jgi:sporulation protein YlmC with PRC-barrel domain
MTVRLSQLFGKDIYTESGDYKGKVFDLVVNLEKGVIETITMEPLRAKTKLEAKKIILEKSVPYNKVKAVKDIMVIGSSKKEDAPIAKEEEQEVHNFRRYHRKF